MIEILAVGIGGAIGSIIRYLISIIPYKSSFPIHTFITNILGAIIIGVVIGLIDEGIISGSYKKSFLKTGFCGGLTTFSTFSYESLILFESKKYFQAFSYALFSLFLCIIGVYIGKFLSKKLI